MASASPPAAKKAKTKGKQVRVWMDGCFDFTHWGHANALRQAKQLGDYLVVGVHSDEEIRRNKGPPVMTEWERYTAVRACKWVDEVVENAPYKTDVPMLRMHNIDFVVHGDDIVLAADGTDAYENVRAVGMFRTVPRTIGVSTTDIVGRMLLMARRAPDPGAASDANGMPGSPIRSQLRDSAGPETRMSHFLPSSKRIVQFSDGAREPKPGDRVVYADGGFDLFHVGHIEFLRAARALGDYLIVGICTDADIGANKGPSLPIMSLHERALGVLSCRYADEVIIGAPWAVTGQMIDDLRVSVVAHGAVYEGGASEAPADDGTVDPYGEAKRRGIFRAVDSKCNVTTSELISRIIKNRMAFEERNAKKRAKDGSEAGNAEKY